MSANAMEIPAEKILEGVEIGLRPADADPRMRSPWRRYAWIAPAALLALLCGSAILAPWIAPQNPYDLTQIELRDGYLAPRWLLDDAERAKPERHGSLFFLGSDGQGRDMLSAVLFGLRVSLLVGVSGTLIALAIGVTLGLVAGYFGGWFEASVMRVADVQLSFPSILIALFLMAVWEQGVGKIIIAVGIVHWVLYARIVRGSVLAEREKDYIAAVRALGARAPRILIGHLLPNVASPVLVVSAVQFASVVMLEATLSFLGLGVPITRPSLGMLIRFGYKEFFSGSWWIWVFPGLALVLLVIAINWLADVLRDTLSVER